MITEYINAALENAHYEILPEGEGYFGNIPELKGVWANASSLEKCRTELKEVLEEWIIVGLRFGKSIPTMKGVSLVAAEDTL